MRRDRIRRCPRGPAVVGALATTLLTACSGPVPVPTIPTPVPPVVSASPAPRPSASGDLTECAVQLDVPSERVLPLSRFQPPQKAAVSMSTLGEQFTGRGCPRADLIPPLSCAVADFPWVSSPTSRERDLLSRGVRTVLRAEYGVDDRPVLTETVLEAAPGRSVDEVYRKHLTTCGATVRTSENGQPTRWTLGDRDELAIAVAGSVVVTLISRDEQVDALELLDEAVRLAG